MPGSSTYTINYNAILSWIARRQDPFPTQMRAGRIKYYGSIPTSITGSWPSYGSTDQRFWKEVIDYTLGFYQTDNNGTYQDASAMCGYGSDFTWGSVSTTAPSSLTAPQYMNYSDNPARPKLRFWFGPLNMVDYLHNYNAYDNVGPAYFWQPGDSYEAPQYSGKQAFLAAVNTMQTNHPNDWFTLVPYSWPRTYGIDHRPGASTAWPARWGPTTPTQKPPSFSPSPRSMPTAPAISTEITPYDADPVTGNIPSANFEDTPRPDGDTCFAMALMLAYNQFAVTPSSDATLRTFVTSTPITFPTGMAGGLGRKGAQKVIIFETDGLANCSATASLVTPSGATYSYYKIRYDMNKPNSSEYPSIGPTNINDSGVLSQVYSLVDQLKSDFGTTRNPFRLYAIGFGPVFAGADATDAQTTLQTMQYHAGTQSSASTALPSSQIVTGTDSQMTTNMTTAFTSILQSGVQIALIQ